MARAPDTAENPSGMAFVCLPPESFMTGNPPENSENKDSSQHQIREPVILTCAFNIQVGKEITDAN